MAIHGQEKVTVVLGVLEKSSKGRDINNIQKNIDIIRRMSTIEEQILAIEKEIRETPYHKGTEHHIGKLRARLSKLREKLLESSTKKGGGGGGYAVKKQGDATIILIGPPSSGKSTLINKFTNAQSRVAPYAFTTVSVIPGMMEYNDAKIQILDVPGLIEGAEEGKGRGREVLSVARGADLVILMTDYKRSDALERIHKTLDRNGIRLNIVRPNVVYEKKVSGGITIHSNIKQDLNKEMMKNIINELGVKNADITINEKLTIERLIDAFSPNRVYLPALFVINKSDLLTEKDKRHISENVIYNDISFISAETSSGLTELKEKVWETLNFIRIYLISRDEAPHYNSPLITKKDVKLADIASKIGTGFAERITRAKIWGSGSKFPGQEVSLTTQVQEGVQVRFI